MNEFVFLQERLQVWELIASTKNFPEHNTALIELAESEIKIIKKRQQEI